MMKTSIAASLLLIAGGTLSAEDANADLQKRLDAVEQQVRELKAQQSAVGGAPDAPVIKASAAGFYLASRDDSFTLHLGGYAQAAGKFYLTDDDKPENNSFFMKRMRLLFEGSLGQFIGYRVLADLATSNPLLQDAYAQIKVIPNQVVIQVGKYKPPTGLERLQSDAQLLFIERSIATQLVPDRDIGVQLGGTCPMGSIEYAIGIFDGAPDGGSRDTDTNDDKMFAARVFATPLKAGGERWTKGLGFGIAATVERDQGSPANTDLPVLKTSGEMVPGLTSNVFSYRKGGAPTLANTVISEGWHWRLVPQAYWYAGQLGVQAEYMVSRQGVSLAGSRAGFTNTGWAAQAGWVLTGEDAAYNGVMPRTPFNPQSHAWGAFEVGARIARVSIDGDVFPVYADPAAAVRSATCYGLALNWYLSRNLKLQTDYEITRFDGGAGSAGAVRDLQDEQVIESMLQVLF